MKTQIQAKIVADSISPMGHRLTSIEVYMPRFILSEFNTHRLFSRNSASSRAIPSSKMVRAVNEDMFMPIAWQKAHKGMQGYEYHRNPTNKRLFKGEWIDAAQSMIRFVNRLNELQLTKQITNRLLEPFMWHKVLVTATEWENFLKLRHHQEAEIHIYKVAESIKDQLRRNAPQQLTEGQWHIPYSDGLQGLEVDEQIKISVSRCARLSYQTIGSQPKIDFKADLKLYDKLKKSGHYSPFEHIARCMNLDEYTTNYICVDGEKNLGWSRNFRGFKQYRAIID